jgi:diguanylate cyclase (GGDEF)-like protein
MASGVMAISLATLLASRDAAIQHAHETSRNVTAVLATNIARTIETSDNSLLTLIAALDKPAIQTMDRSLRHELLFDRTAAEYVTGDSHGHAQGDIALKHLAECIDRHVRRRGDLAARYGGEEFVVVLPNTDEAGAFQIGEAIRREVEHREPSASSGVIPPFTVSIGCATGRRSHPSSLEELTSSADLALYAAKRRGRNVVVCAGDIVEPAQPQV